MLRPKPTPADRKRDILERLAVVPAERQRLIVMLAVLEQEQAALLDELAELQRG